MPQIDVKVGVSVRPDGGGDTHDDFDKRAIDGATLLFNKPMKIGLGNESYTIKVTPVSIPKVPEIYANWKQGLAAKDENANKGAMQALHLGRVNFNTAELNGIDLLYIPGAPAATPTQATNIHKMVATSDFKKPEALSRDAFEARVIEAAMARGIPILAVCAGSWRLVEAYGGHVRELSKEDVKVHRHDGWKANHPLVIEPKEMGGSGLMQEAASRTPLRDVPIRGPEGLTVRGVVGANTTHWAVAANQSGGGMLEKRITPLGRTSDRLDPSTALRPVVFEPETEAVEAFESTHGAPVLGTQWHPESFLPGMDEFNGAYSNDGIKTLSQELFRLIILSAVTAKLRRAHVTPSLRSMLEKGKMPETLQKKVRQLEAGAQVLEAWGTRKE